MINNAGCTKCGLCKFRKNICNGTGNPKAKIFIIGEAPGGKEDAYAQPFVGPAGQLLRRLMIQAGLDYRDVFFSNIVRCIPRDAKGEIRAPSYEEMAACAAYLEEEILTVKPTVIVPAGNTALRYIMGAKNLNITRQRGLEIWSDRYNCKICPMFHPAAILRNPKYEGVTVQDLIRIKASSTSSTLTKIGLGTYEVADTKEKVDQLFHYLETEPEISIDIETTSLDWMTSQIISIGFCWKERTGWCLPLLNVKKPLNGDPTEDAPTRFWDDATYLDIIERLKKVAETPEKKWYTWNGKFDLKHLLCAGISFKGSCSDGMLMHHLLDENAENLHGLKDCAWTFTDMGGYDKPVDDFFTNYRKLKRQYIYLPHEILTLYNAADADCTFRICRKFEPMLQAQGLTRLFKQIVMPMSDVFFQTELTGAQVDTDYIEKLRVEYTAKKEELETKIFDKTGEFNIRSAKELRKVLYEDNGFETDRLTKAGELSTDKNTLAELLKEHSASTVLANLLEYKKTMTMLSTFIKGMSSHLDKNGRVHSTYKLHGTATGRSSSAEPNLQNIPRDSTIRGMFISKPGHTLIEADYGQAEFRFWAYYSQDPQMIADIASGKDIHKMTASSAFGIPIDQITKKQRQDAKAIVFGLMYGRGVASVAEQLKITEEEAQRVVDVFFGRYPQAKRWLKDIVYFARHHGYVKNHFGRLRRLPGINSTDQEVRGEAERQAKNSPIQSGASDMTFIASMRIRRELEKNNLHGQLVLTVHDSVIYEVPDNEVDASVKIIKTEIERPIEGVNVKMMAEIKRGVRWGELEEVHFEEIALDKV